MNPNETNPVPQTKPKIKRTQVRIGQCSEASKYHQDRWEELKLEKARGRRKFRGHGIPSEVLGLDGRRGMYAHQDFSTLSKKLYTEYSLISLRDDVCE